MSGIRGSTLRSLIIRFLGLTIKFSSEREKEKSEKKSMNEEEKI